MAKGKGDRKAAETSNLAKRSTRQE